MIIPCRIGVRKSTLSLDAVTTIDPENLLAATNAALSINAYAAPPNIVPIGFVSCGKTISVMITGSARFAWSVIQSSCSLLPERERGWDEGFQIKDQSPPRSTGSSSLLPGWIVLMAIFGSA